jgi:hypothetical protein
MKRTLAIMASLLFLGVFGLGVKSLFAAPERVPFTIINDFETGEMEGWEAYPYAQDIGYEPFTTCMRKPTHNKSKFALGKIQRPNDIVELSEGFTKEIDLWTAADTRMKLALFLVSDRNPETIEFSLCMFDGHRYFYTMKSPECDQWLETDIPVNNFIMNGKSLESGQHVQAITIKVNYRVVSHMLSYTILLDDFSLNGERTRRFLTVDPLSTTFELYGFSILNKHFFYGDSFGISVKPEDSPGKGAPSNVACILLDPSGKAVVSGVPLKAGGGAWTTANVYTFKTTDPRGQWTASFSGKDTRGNETQWGFRFLMPGNRLTSKDHPRLYFTAEELKKKIADQSPAEKKILQGSLANPANFKSIDLNQNMYKEGSQNVNTESATGGPYMKAEFEYDSWRSPMSRLAGIIESGAWLYAFTGDMVAGEKAKEAMLKLCAFRVWNHPWMEAHGNHIYYPVGYTMGPIGIGYDYLYPLMTEQERKFVRDAIVEKGIRMFYRDMVEMNRMPSSVTNHIAVIVSNLVLDATAIYGDDPANPSFEPYLSGILAKMKRYMDRTFYPDGGYGENIDYQDMACRELVKALPVLEKNFGIDYTSTTNMKDTYLYALYATNSKGDMPEFGDDYVKCNYNLTGNTFLWLSYHMKNPWTYYFIQKSPETGRGGILRYFWQPQGITPKNRDELIPSHCFAVKGNMVMRSDWSDAGSILVFKCGPNSNHYHVDQGTFQLMTNGERLLTEAGDEGDYYANLHYPCYDTQPIGHNVMLIDNDAESQVPADYENSIAALQNYPRILHSFAGWNADEVEGDLTCVYKGKIDKYTRSWLFMKPGILFLYDTVKSPREHTYSWLFHSDHVNGKNPITVSNKTLDIELPKARLHMDILAPEIATSRIRKSWREESFATLATAGGMKDTEFLAVLVPNAVNDPSAPAIKPVSTLLNISGWTAARVENGDTVTEAYFRKAGATGVSTAGEYTIDADRFAVETGKNGEVRKVFLRGTSLAGGKGLSFKSARPVSASVTYTVSGVDVETDSSTITEIKVGMPKAPSTVTLNGSVTKDWKYDTGLNVLQLNIPTGHAVMKMN